MSSKLYTCPKTGNQTSLNPNVSNTTSHCFDYSKPCVTIIDTLKPKKRGARFVPWGYYSFPQEAYRIASELAEKHPDWIVNVHHEYLDQEF